MGGLTSKRREGRGGGLLKWDGRKGREDRGDEKGGEGNSSPKSR